MSRNILVVAPHADDEVLGVGGTILKHIELGDCVHIVVCGCREQDEPDHIIEATKHCKSVKILPYRDEHYYDEFDFL